MNDPRRFIENPSRSIPDPEYGVVRRTAALARLDVTEAEVETLGRQFARILEQFQVISSISVEGVEPMTGATRRVDVRREDRPRPSLPSERALKNAPERVDDYYSVPKTIGGEG